MVEGSREGKTVSTDGESHEAELHGGKLITEVGRDNSATFLLARQTETVTATRRADLIPGRIVVRLEEPRVLTAVAETSTDLERKRGRGRLGKLTPRETEERAVNGFTLATPAGVTEGQVQRILRAQGSFVRVKGRRKVPTPPELATINTAVIEPGRIKGIVG